MVKPDRLKDRDEIVMVRKGKGLIIDLKGMQLDEGFESSRTEFDEVRDAGRGRGADLTHGGLEHRRKLHISRWITVGP